jgi:hypothetical protein
MQPHEIADQIKKLIQKEYNSFGGFDRDSFDKECETFIEGLDSQSRHDTAANIASQIEQNLSQKIPYFIPQLARMLCLFRKDAAPHLQVILECINSHEINQEGAGQIMDRVNLLANHLPEFVDWLWSNLDKESLPTNTVTNWQTP